MYSIIKNLLFILPPEKAHKISLSLFGFALRVPLLKSLIRQMFRFEHHDLHCTVGPLTFKNPVGLAAGFDKDGKYINIMESLGFGYIEVGTVTPRPQTGNPKPRLFRLPKDRALINRMGFNNEGLEALTGRLRRYRKEHPKSDLIIGGNIGKNKDTPNENALDDYAICMKSLHPHVDYFAVNVSSPNTPNLRDLQAIEPLKKLLTALQAINNQMPVPKPVFLKIAPDLHRDHLNDIIDLVTEIDLDGIIATNTTIERKNLRTNESEVARMGAGGLSGSPVLKKSNNVISSIKQKNPDLPVIGVGGIDSPNNALKKMHAGADCIQLYTGLIYAGPFLVKKIKQHLISRT